MRLLLRARLICVALTFGFAARTRRLRMQEYKKRLPTAYCGVERELLFGVNFRCISSTPRTWDKWVTSGSEESTE
jgi:hypothetical protein